MRDASASDASTTSDVAKQLKEAEEQAAASEAEKPCESPIAVYEGGIPVSEKDYLHPVTHGDDVVDEPIQGLDRVISKAKRIRFTLDYPFEKPFAGEVAGKITLRRTIDAIRAGFRQMYAGSTEREVPGMLNKDVTGRYGRAFHAISDLYIESIELCADDTLRIGIGS